VICPICASGYLKRESIHEGLISAWDTIATLNSGARLNRPGRTAGAHGHASPAIGPARPGLPEGSRSDQPHKGDRQN
jgi:hypothetical protein